MPDLFPVFEVPKVIDSGESSAKQRSGIYFDFEKGDFKLDNGGRIETASPYEVWIQWCLKTVYTQRWAYLGYSDRIGVETEEAFNQESRETIESYIEYTIFTLNFQIDQKNTLKTPKISAFLIKYAIYKKC